MSNTDNVDRVILERGMPVPMRDGVVLVADVYRPDDDGRWPTLVTRTPYLRGRQGGSFVNLNPVDAAVAGFAVVVQDVRGRGDSGGEFEAFQESEDGYDTVEWAAAQPWSTGRVGLFGSSYMAATQMQALVTAPPALAAVCPIQASCDYYEGRTYRGGAFELGGLMSTSLGPMGQSSLDRMGRARADEVRPGVRRALNSLAAPPRFPLSDLLEEGDAVRRVAPWFFDWVEHDVHDEYWARIDLTGRHNQATAPALHVTSWFDQFHDGALDNYQALRAHPDAAVRDGQYLIVGPWDHYGLRGQSHGVAKVGDMSFGAASAINLDLIQLAWFRQWVGEQPGGFRQQNRVRYFVMGCNEWRYASEWPPPGASEQTFYLTGDQLTDRLAPTQSLRTFDYDPLNPVPTTGGAHLVPPLVSPSGGCDQTQVEQREDVIVYTSEPLVAALEVVGRVLVQLHVASSAPCTDFTCRLTDVDPAGRSISVCDGIRRVDLGAPLFDRDDCAIELDLGSTAYSFATGHRLRLQVSSSNYPRFDPNPNTGERSFDAEAAHVAHQVIKAGATTPSRITMPVVA